MQSFPASAASDPDALDQLKRLLLDQPALQAELAWIEADGTFAETVAAVACAHGLALDAEAVRRAIRPDPLGLSRWSGHGGGAAVRGWPGAEWSPMHLHAWEPEPAVDWIRFGDLRPTDPFFEETVRRAAGRPFNRLVRIRTPLADFLADAEPVAPPDGLIFHMSRCGSTLVAQMLAASPSNVVISEAPPLDAMVQLYRRSEGDGGAAALRAMAAALCRRAEGEEHRRFLKLDCWHTLSLPLFRRAFPETPWVFLYRDPLEVMASQMAQRGLQTVHGALDPDIFAIKGGEAMAGEDYCARVLAKTCRAALDNLPLGGGLLVGYQELPDALWTRILPHFGVAPSAAEASLMNAVAARDAKAPHAAFTPDGPSKRQRAGGAVQEMTERWLAPLYAELESARRSAPPPTPRSA